MTKGVFIHRIDSIYDDDPAVRYQFPTKNYLSRAAQMVGEWVLYYEPVKAGGKGYFAVARVANIVPDPTNPEMHLAIIEDYLPFERTVPFRDSEGLLERGLLNEYGVISGRAQSAVRPISDQDFSRIISRGLEEEQAILPRTEPLSDFNRLHDERSPFQFEVDRERVDILMSRAVRDRVFRKLVLDAYDSRCALTGLKLINGGGRAEVEAAHIKPVERGGPDSVSNGLALSGTAHWMFDRGLVCLGDDLEIQISRHVNDIDSVKGLLRPNRQAAAPASPALRPHPHFLAWHRENCFKH